MNDYIEAMKNKATESCSKGFPKTAAEIMYRIENELTEEGYCKKGFSYSDKSDVMKRAQRLVKEGWDKSEALKLANMSISDLAVKMRPLERLFGNVTRRF